ncbi:MAG: hypothetical protein M3680_04430 [Myxococcota bacterium]|nr:hypothetical protein [Myxococcota bacterium]
MAETVAILPGVPVSMTMQGDELLVATSGEILSSGRLYRLPKAGGTSDLLYRKLGRVPTLAVSGDRILVGESSAVFGCEVSNTSGGLLSIGPEDNVTVLSRGRRCPHSLNAAQEGLFWVEQNAVQFLAPGESTPTSLFDGNISRLELLDADMLLLIDSTARIPTLKTMPRTGGPVTSLLTLDGSALAIREGQVAFGRGSDIVVHTLATGTEARIPIPAGGITAIALDASFVYWVSNGALFVGDPLEGTQRVLARVGGLSLLQDETFVYVLSSDGTAARITRIRKPANARPSIGFVTCEPPLRACGFDGCVDLTSDRSNCGDCGRGCAAGEVCEAGECACAPASVCGSSCVDLMVDAQHCGACDHACPGSCVGGACAPVVLTADEPNPSNGFAQDDAAIYFARGGLRRLDKQTHAVAALNTMEFTGSIAVVSKSSRRSSAWPDGKHARVDRG